MNILRIFILGIMLCTAQSVMAQSSTVASKTSDADIVFDTAAVNKTLDTLTKKLNTKKVSREETDDFMDTLTALQTQTQNSTKANCD